MKSSWRVAVILLLLPCMACPEQATVRSADPPGDRGHYDPFAALDAVRAFAGTGVELLSINARFVRRDGSMDLDAGYDPYAVYTFVRPKSADSDKPVGAGGGAAHEKVVIRVGAPGMLSRTATGSPNVKLNVHHKGMVEVGSSKAKKKDLEETVAPPQCTTASLWAKAIEAGAPEDAVAVILYDEHGYSFRIEDLEVRHSFDFSCEPGRERSAKALERDERKAEKKSDKELRKEEKRRKREEKKRERDQRLGR